MRSGWLIGGALFLGVACSGKTLPYAGGLMVAVQTDLKAPDDVSAVGLYISSDGRPIYEITRDVAPTGEVRFPATIAVLADESRPRAVVKIRAVAFKKNGDVRVLRDTITTVPKGRTGLLRMPLLWLNEGSGTGNSSKVIKTSSIRPLDAADGFSGLQSSCPDGQTYIDGECGDAHVDGDALPEYAEKDVFGGGDANGNGGRCFDVIGCFKSPVKVEIDAATCAGTAAGVDPNDPTVSLFAVLPPSAGTGECTQDGKCLVPLDKGVSWKVAGTGFQFPTALCKRIADGSALGVASSKGCPTKDATTPSCGPASSVSGNATASSPSGGDAGPAAGGDGGPVADGGPPAEAGGQQDFALVFSYTGEPYLSSIGIDDTYVYIARSDVNPPPPGVVRLLKSDVIVPQQSSPSILTSLGSPTLSNIFLSASTASSQHVLVRDDPNDLRLCLPTSQNDCSSLVISGSRFATAAGPTQAWAYGTFSVNTGVFSIDYLSPAPQLLPILPGVIVSSMVFAPDPNNPQGGLLYLGATDAAIYKCVLPCSQAADASQLRAAPSSPATVTAIATSPTSGKVYFIQMPTGSDPTAGGVFEVGADGSGEFQIAPAADLGGPNMPLPPSALAVDSRYVYWGGGYDSPSGRRAGLLARNVVTRAPSSPIPEGVPGVDQVTGVAVDATHVFWTYDRSDQALLVAAKKGQF